MSYTITTQDQDMNHLQYPCASKRQVAQTLAKHGRDIDFCERVYNATYKCPQGLLLCGYWHDEDDISAIIVEGPDVLDWESLGDIWIGRKGDR